MRLNRGKILKLINYINSKNRVNTNINQHFKKEKFMKKITIATLMSITLMLISCHSHNFTNATCTEPKKCECGEKIGEPLGHTVKIGVCDRCGENINYEEMESFHNYLNKINDDTSFLSDFFEQTYYNYLAYYPYYDIHNYIKNHVDTLIDIENSVDEIIKICQKYPNELSDIGRQAELVKSAIPSPLSTDDKEALKKHVEGMTEFLNQYSVLLKMCVEYNEEEINKLDKFTN